MSWLPGTLVWTGVLIALILLVRRPVARHFGAGTAYALWLLPLLRLVLPPIILPARERAPDLFAAPTDLSVLVEVTGGGFQPDLASVAASASPAPVPSWLSELDALLTVLWAAGAIFYVALRLMAYRKLRGELLADARTVGFSGRIRLVETSATRSPLAFGVFDKVVALPPGFMAQSDRMARDLALEHEFAHHRAHDLAVNFAALPLFAIHWFNPLSWLGWTAMRRDQEAACDARVVAGRGRDERARYATIIAGAATAPRTALAAPMACPVLGDKSIVQRLRNLTMVEHSRRRRRAGSTMIAAGALMLPLTASFSCAQAAQAAQAVPAPIEEIPVPPSAPAAPAAMDAPEPPEVDQPPEAPLPPEVHIKRFVIEDDDDGSKEKRVFVVRAPNAKDMEHLTQFRGPDGRVLTPGNPEYQDHMKKLAERLGKLDHDIEIRMLENGKHFRALTDNAMRMALVAPRIEMNCDGPDGVSAGQGDDGQQVYRFCRSRMMGAATIGLRSARAQIAANKHMDAETRQEVLKSLDREIERLETDN